jgi:hypothetical protein
MVQHNAKQNMYFSNMIAIKSLQLFKHRHRTPVLSENIFETYTGEIYVRKQVSRWVISLQENSYSSL